MVLVLAFCVLHGWVGRLCSKRWRREDRWVKAFWIGICREVTESRPESKTIRCIAMYRLLSIGSAICSAFHVNDGRRVNSAPELLDFATSQLRTSASVLDTNIHRSPTYRYARNALSISGQLPARRGQSTEAHRLYRVVQSLDHRRG